ncbi:MAG: hypothetical protein LBB10_01065 [Bifidobacteriaceae bacterium]|jgi:hypothetical protein|nr:hypothetical protein [Bifidobacteriaceae bacterium]
MVIGIKVLAILAALFCVVLAGIKLFKSAKHLLFTFSDSFSKHEFDFSTNLEQEVYTPAVDQNIKDLAKAVFNNKRDKLKSRKFKKERLKKIYMEW